MLAPLLRAAARRRREPGRGRAVTSASGSSADERVDCVAFTGSVETGKRIARAVRRARRADQPRAGRQGPVHRLRGRRRRDRRRRPRRRLGRLPERRPGVHVGRALLRAWSRSTTTSCRRSSTTRETLVVGDPLDPETDIGPMVSARQRAKVERRSRPRSRRARRSSRAATAGDRGYFFAPAVVTGAPARDRPAARGDVRPGGADRAGDDARRGDRARELDALRARRERLHARPRDDRALHARDQGRHGRGSTTR